MRLPDTTILDTPALLEFAENAVHGSNSQIRDCSRAIQVLSSRVRSIALETIDVLLSSPSHGDIDQRKVEVVKQYSAILFDFSRNIEDPLADLNKAWMALDQDLGFYLLSAGRATDTNPEKLRQLIDVMVESRKDIPDTRAQISNVTDAIKASAGGLLGLEDAIAESISMLNRLTGELHLGDAVLQRQILLSERLYDLMAAT